jgi:hypothetical protein
MEDQLIGKIFVMPIGQKFYFNASGNISDYAKSYGGKKFTVVNQRGNRYCCVLDISGGDRNIYMTKTVLKKTNQSQKESGPERRKETLGTDGTG